jgi:hypothetical protein
LLAHGDGGDTRQVNDGQVGAAGREYAEHNWDINDDLFGAAYFVGDNIDGFANLREVGEFLFAASF